MKQNTFPVNVNNFSAFYVYVSQGYSCCICSNPQGKIENIWHDVGLSLVMISSLRNEEQKLFSLYLGLLSHNYYFSCISPLPQISVIMFYNIKRVLSSAHIYTHTHTHFRDF